MDERAWCMALDHAIKGERHRRLLEKLLQSIADAAEMPEKRVKNAFQAENCYMLLGVCTVAVLLTLLFWRLEMCAGWVAGSVLAAALALCGGILCLMSRRHRNARIARVLLEKNRRLLSRLYRLMQLEEKHRELSALYMLQELMAMGFCVELHGAGGAIAVYEAWRGQDPPPSAHRKVERNETWEKRIIQECMADERRLYRHLRTAQADCREMQCWLRRNKKRLLS